MKPVAEIRTVVVERDLAHPPGRVWRALTQPHLMAEWLLKSDFAPVVDRPFRFETGFGGIDCKVLSIEEGVSLAYSWDALGLESTVTWTLEPTAKGTRLRMEQTGFRPDQEQAFRGATAGWHRFFESLEATLEKID